MLRKMSIGAKLILVGALTILIPLALVGVYSVANATRGLTSLAEEQLYWRAFEIATGIDNVFQAEVRGARKIAHSPIAESAAEAIARGESRAESQAVVETGYAFVSSADGTAIAHPNSDFVFELSIDDLDGMEAIARAALAGERGVERYRFGGIDRTAGFAPVPVTGWSVVLTVPDTEFLTTAIEVRDAVLLIALIAFVIGLIAFVIFARSISKPVAEAVAFTQIVAGGDISQKVPDYALRRGDELGVLAHSLDRMQKALSDVARSIHTAVENVSSGSEQLSSTAQEMSQGATEQASSAEEVSSSMEQMGANIQQNSDNATTTDHRKTLAPVPDHTATNRRNGRSTASNRAVGGVAGGTTSIALALSAPVHKRNDMTDGDFEEY